MGRVLTPVRDIVGYRIMYGFDKIHIYGNTNLSNFILKWLHTNCVILSGTTYVY